MGYRMTSLWMLLLLAAVSGVSAQNVSVFQPAFVSAVEGESVTLECSYNSTAETQIGHFTWFYHPLYGQQRIEVSHKAELFSGRFVATNLSTFFAEKKADIILLDVRLYDVGKYVCEVWLFTVGFGHGAGTSLQVRQGAVTTRQEAARTESADARVPANVVLQSARTVGVLLLFSFVVLLIARHYAKKYPKLSVRGPAAPEVKV